MEFVIWIIDSTYTGELSARYGVAKWLSNKIPAKIYIISQESLFKMLGDKREALKMPKPDLLLSGTGEDLISPVLELAEYFEETLNVFLASIVPEPLDPLLHLFDIVASPQDANFKGENVVNLLGVPHEINQETLKASQLRWESYYMKSSKPLVGVILGGNTRYCKGFTEKYATRLAEKIYDVGETMNASYVLTNSRRTPKKSLEVIRRILKDREFAFHDWQDPGRDAYLGMLAVADLMLVTGDSLSMVTEAAVTGQPLYVTTDAEAMESCHIDSLNRFIKQGYAHPFEQFGLHTNKCKPLDPTEVIGQKILDRFKDILSAKRQSQKSIMSKPGYVNVLSSTII